MPSNGWLPALVLLLGAGLVPVSAQAIEGRVVVLGEGGGPSPGLSASASTASTYDLPPSVTTTYRSPYGQGEQKQKERFACVLVPEWIIVPNCTITLNWRAASGSGGHEHDGGRPPGRIKTENGVIAGSIGPGAVSDPTPQLADSSGAEGILDTTYVAPEAAGRTRVRFWGFAIVFGQPVYFQPNQFDLRIGLAGLVQLPGKSDRFGTALERDGHGYNDGHVRPLVQEALKQAWDRFVKDADPGGTPEVPERLFISSANLPAGGLFDLDENWKKPHVGHRFGLDVDLEPWFKNPMTEKQKRLLATKLRHYSFVFPVDDEAPRTDSPSHWHARFSD